jgi:putative ATP-dependent endonuclease of the OLD family
MYRNDSARKCVAGCRTEEGLTMDSIQLDRVHIQNYRSCGELNLNLNNATLLFGKNDSGKSNILRALKLAFTNANINMSDVFVCKREPSCRKKVTVDVRFVPIDESGKVVPQFNDAWFLHLGSSVMVDNEDAMSFAFRTEFIFDEERGEFIRGPRRVITKWDEVDVVVGEQTVGPATMGAFNFFLLDADRDIAEDITDRYSEWNKELSRIKIPDETSTQIEEKLSTLGNEIVEISPFLTLAQDNLGTSTDEQESIATISPISRNVNELYKGLDVFIETDDGIPLTVANFGSGTRSRAVFATYQTLVNAKMEAAVDTPCYCLMAFEEPEAHIHPHSQKQLLDTFNEISAQSIITTHSQNILSVADINDLVYVSKSHSETACKELKSIGLGADEQHRIERTLLRTRGDVLFSSVVILAEGETEEQALPVFYRERYKKYPHAQGVSIIGVGGSKNYDPFISVCEYLHISWLIFSDGENQTIKNIVSQVSKHDSEVTKESISQDQRVVFLDGGTDFESYLVKEGYAEEIISAINKTELDYGFDYIEQTYFDFFKQNYDGTRLSKKSTGECCKSCGQPIKEDQFRDYSGDEGSRQALLDCMKMNNGKTKYADAIAQSIVNSQDPERKIPQKISDLFDKVDLVRRLAG